MGFRPGHVPFRAGHGRPVAMKMGEKYPKCHKAEDCRATPRITFLPVVAEFSARECLRAAWHRVRDTVTLLGIVTRSDGRCRLTRARCLRGDERGCLIARVGLCLNVANEPL